MAKDLDDWAARAVFRAAEQLGLAPTQKRKGQYSGVIDRFPVRVRPSWESHGDGTHSVSGADAFITIKKVPARLRIQRDKPRRGRKWKRVICRAGPDIYVRADKPALAVYLERERIGLLCDVPSFRLRKSEMHLDILVRGGADITTTVTHRIRAAIRAADALTAAPG